VYGPVGNYKVEKAPQIVCVGWGKWPAN
jgi:hypothetical protein